MTKLLQYGAGVVATGACLTALVGVLHMPFAAPLLRTIAPASMCPVRHGSPEQVDRATALGAAAIRASTTRADIDAPARPAAGFELDVTRKADVDAWAARHHVTCGAIAGNPTLQRCTDVPAAAIGETDDLGRLEEVTFEFRRTGELAHVQTLRRRLSPTQASLVATRLESNVASAVGAPSVTGGEPTAAHLSHGFLATFVAEHSFRDYRATIDATNLAPTGTMVRESYLSAR